MDTNHIVASGELLLEQQTLNQRNILKHVYICFVLGTPVPSSSHTNTDHHIPTFAFVYYLQKPGQLKQKATRQRQQSNQLKR